MKKNLILGLATAVAASASVAASSVQAQATVPNHHAAISKVANSPTIHQVNDSASPATSSHWCDWGGYFEFFYDDGGQGNSSCFVNAGDIGVNIWHVSEFRSGNNAGYFNADGSRHWFAKHEDITNLNYTHVTFLHIS